MVEIVLHRVPGAEIERTHGEAIRTIGESAKEDLALNLRCAIFDAVPEEGVTPEELFNIMMIATEFARAEMAPHQFFLIIVSLLKEDLISSSIRKVAAA